MKNLLLTISLLAFVQTALYANKVPSDSANQAASMRVAQFFATYAPDDKKQDNQFPNYSHVSLNTGLGKSFRNNNYVDYNAPFMLFWEQSGNLFNNGALRGLINVPNWIYGGGYIRYSSYEVVNTGSFTYSGANFGAGARVSASVFPAIAAITGQGMRKTGPLDVYCGFHLGYDYVWYDNWYSYYGYYGNTTGLKANPFLGGRFYLTKWFGLHAELGSTSNRYMTVGVNFRKKR
jgi:hypothetical protein